MFNVAVPGISGEPLCKVVTSLDKANNISYKLCTCITHGAK